MKKLNKQRTLFWSTYIFILLILVSLAWIGDILILGTFGETILIIIFLLIVGVAFKRWFDEWYKDTKNG
ncbi:MAG: hypothetical protein HWE26_08240 [Alteromonadaceae bacterium]|nr:hypothetical protein [Alteromonadaceae bacterium]